MKVRKPRFDFAAVPVHWAAGDPLLTHLLNAFHVIIPDGEMFFIRTVRKLVEESGDPQLRELAQNFIGQEGWHQRAHRDFWNRLREQGLAVDRVASLYQRLGVEMLEEGLGRLLPLSTRLAITAALEHYTAVLSSVMFEADFPMNAFDEEMQRLHLWHGAEELEHKAVAFDMLALQEVQYAERTAGFLVASLLVFGFAGMGFCLFAASDRRFLRALRKSHPERRTLLRPQRLLRITGSLLRYLKPGFHPGELEDPPRARHFLLQFDATLENTARPKNPVAALA